MFVLSEIFGDCPQVKILEAFAIKPDEMLYLTDIFRITGISKITVNKHLIKFLEEGIIEKKEKDGRIQYYQLNRDNPKVKIILSLVKHIENRHLEELIKKDIVNDNEIYTSDNGSFTFDHTQSNTGYTPMSINSTNKL